MLISDWSSDVCSSDLGRYCPKLKAPTTFYHNVSITQEIADRFEITFGIANLLNTRPPRESVLNGGQISTLGPVIVASQYPFDGRRAFLRTGRASRRARVCQYV